MAGRLRLAATGVQDQWLTGEPQFSYFLMNYKRHTKFAVDYIESQFDGKIDFGEVLDCRIPNDKGDLIRNMTLKVTLTDPAPDTAGRNDTGWSPSIISHLIEYAELIIGGQVIERITGEYIYLQQQLNNTNDDTEQTLYFLNGHGNILSYQGQYTYFVDLPFYFHRNPTLAIPTCALTKQLVEVKIKTRPLAELIYGGKGLYGPSYEQDITGTINKFSLDTEFVYVDSDESNFLKSNPIDYVITQVQLSKFKMKPGENEKEVLLKFSHPVKELLFVSQSEESVQNNYPNEYNTITNVELRFNNEVVFNRNEKFLVYEQSLKHHINSPLAKEFNIGFPFNNSAFTFGPARFAMYSFSLKPDVHYPTGQVNMSRIAHKSLRMKINPINSTDSNNTRVYAINYNVLRIQSGLAGLIF